MTAKIPLVDLAAEHRALQAEIERAALRVLRSGVYILGPEVAAFEVELAAYVGVRHVVACASGTDAITLALLAIGLRSGDEVIVPAFGFQADAEAISLLGGVPRFADIDPVTFAIDPACAAKLVTRRTRAVIPTHLYGLPADMDRLRDVASEHRLVVIEDACQAIGSRYGDRSAGSLGDVGCFSFFPTKNLGACGDGGALTTSDADLAASLRRLRNHGAREKHVHEAIGLNSRLDELQAAILRVKLAHLDHAIARRRTLRDRYDGALVGTPNITLPTRFADRESNAHLYTIRSPHREALRRALAAEGIAAAVHYPHATHQQPVYENHAGVPCPRATEAAAEVLSLPLFPEMDEADVDRVAAAVRRFDPARS